MSIVTPEQRGPIVEKLFADCMEVLKAKGASYAGRQDINANFKRIAERLGLTKYQVWAIYWNKHIDSINNAIIRQPECPTSCDGETLYGRVIDLINYEAILVTLQIEDGVITQEAVGA